MSTATYPYDCVYATFDTPAGADEALDRLKKAEKNWSINIENAAVIRTDASGASSFSETEDLGGWRGIGNGLLIGGLVGLIFPPSLPLSAALGAAALGLGARIHDAGFDDNALRAVAANMAPDTSILLAIIRHDWVNNLYWSLEPYATQVGYAAITEEVSSLLEQMGKEVNVARL